jgi:hypothetical protein
MAQLTTATASGLKYDQKREKYFQSGVAERNASSHCRCSAPRLPPGRTILADNSNAGQLDETSSHEQSERNVCPDRESLTLPPETAGHASVVSALRSTIDLDDRSNIPVAVLRIPMTDTCSRVPTLTGGPRFTPVQRFPADKRTCVPRAGPARRSMLPFTTLDFEWGPIAQRGSLPASNRDPLYQSDQWLHFAAGLDPTIQNVFQASTG